MSKSYPVRQAYALNGDATALVTQYSGSIDTFGFPSVMRENHKKLKQLINKIPLNDINGEPARNLFLSALAELADVDEATVSMVCDKIADGSAKIDLLEKRISVMTPADFIVDKDLQTPDDQAVKSIKKMVLGDQEKRFATLEVTPGKPSNEWASLDTASEVDGPSF